MVSNLCLPWLGKNGTGTTTSEQLHAFASVVWEDSDVIEVRCLPYEKPKNQDDPGTIRYWIPAQELPDLVPELRRVAVRRYNIYAGLNPRKHNGAASDDGVAMARCLAVDSDPANGGGDVAGLVERIANAGLPRASLVLRSGNGCWAVWRLAEAMTDLDAWKGIQKRLILALGTDHTVHNPERIIRLPGFINLKPGKAPRLAYVVDADPAKRYSLEDFAVLPMLPDPKPAPTPCPTFPSSATRPDLLRAAMQYVGKAKVCGEGGRNASAFRLAGHAFAFRTGEGEALGEAEVLELMRGWNARNAPPLPDDELVEVVRSAMTHGDPREPKIVTTRDDRMRHRVMQQVALRGREVSYV